LIEFWWKEKSVIFIYTLCILFSWSNSEQLMKMGHVNSSQKCTVVVEGAAAQQ